VRTTESVTRLLVLRVLLLLTEQVRSAETTEPGSLVWTGGVVLRLAGRGLLGLLSLLLSGLGLLLLLLLLGSLLLLALRAETA
jgi:hypothetical protein